MRRGGAPVPPAPICKSNCRPSTSQPGNSVFNQSTYLPIYLSAYRVHLFTYANVPKSKEIIHTYMHAYIHTCIHTYIQTYITYIHACIPTVVLYSTLHYIALHYITLHFIALHYITLHCTTFLRNISRLRF